MPADQAAVPPRDSAHTHIRDNRSPAKAGGLHLKALQGFREDIGEAGVQGR